ncbi:MAG: rhomboid family intramembrane serine protease [Candidatus Pacearchaeota archaeon]
MTFFLNKKGKSSFNLSVNLTLILLNVALFIIFTILLETGVLEIQRIAITPSDILDGKNVWTFLTSMFMHGGIFHLFVNMMSLFFFGSLTEKILGPKRYLGFYLIAGIFASVFFVVSAFIFPDLMNTPAVGASGALFGVVGLLILLTPNLPVYAMFIPIPIKLKYAGPGLLALLWLISLGADINIGNTAHLGGLLAGLAYGVYLRINYRNKVRAISRHFS